MKKYYNMIAIDLSKQQERSNTTNFVGDLAQSNNTAMFFITEEAKGTILDVLQGTVRVLRIYFTLT